MATNFGSLVSQLEDLAQSATEANAASGDSVEVKASRLAANLAAVLKTEGFPLDPSDAWFDQLDAIKALGPTAFPREDGDAISSRLAKLLALDEDDRPAAFANVAPRAEAAVNAWHEAAPKRGRRSTGGGGSVPEGQLLSTSNLARVVIDVSMPDGSTKHFEPASNWSNVSYTIAQVTKDLAGDTYGVLDPSSREAWRAAREAIRTGNMGPHTFSVNTGETGVVTVTMRGVALAAEAAA